MSDFISNSSQDSPILPKKTVRRGRPSSVKKEEAKPSAHQQEVPLVFSSEPSHKPEPQQTQHHSPTPEVHYSFDPSPSSPDNSTSESSPPPSPDRPQSQHNENRPRHQHQHQHQNRKFNKNPNQSQHSNNPNQQRRQHSQPQQSISQPKPKSSPPQVKKRRSSSPDYDPTGGLKIGSLPQFEPLKSLDSMREFFAQSFDSLIAPFNFNSIYSLPLQELAHTTSSLGIPFEGAPHRKTLLNATLTHSLNNKTPIAIQGVFEQLDDSKAGVLVQQHDNYDVTDISVYVPEAFVKQYGLKRGHIVDALIHPPRLDQDESAPFALDILKIMGLPPLEITKTIPFTDLTPYYPTERIFLETNNDVTWDNLSMRVVDILTPIGLGQRGIIVAPPRTGKTMLLQSIVHSIALNKPDAHIIVLLIDERPEEVTDFKRQTTSGEVISSTFDQPADSHVHAAEMVIEKSRRLVEHGHHVVIILDSLTRLARAYNTMMPSSGKILSGGIEASSLRGPKRFFGSARNIENGGSLTILASALIDTGSKMDEVIFEEFKGAGNMELHLDRDLVNKRLFPAIAMDKSGTRKEELLYHKDELQKIYALRRAMKGVPSLEAMEMLITRVKKTKSNLEFLLALNR